MNRFTDYFNLKVKTEILESLGWDELKLSQLEEYLNTEFNNINTKHPIIIIKEIKEHFGEDTSKVIEALFKDQLKTIINFNGGMYDEH